VHARLPVFLAIASGREHRRFRGNGRVNREQPDITDFGNDVFQIDTRMAGYQGITAGYLIRGSRPCLVETGTAASAPTVRRALAKRWVRRRSGRVRWPKRQVGRNPPSCCWRAR
jgi:hypothetical protein